jgi:hypothetical protein
MVILPMNNNSKSHKNDQLKNAWPDAQGPLQEKQRRGI